MTVGRFPLAIRLTRDEIVERLQQNPEVWVRALTSAVEVMGGPYGQPAEEFKALMNRRDFSEFAAGLLVVSVGELLRRAYDES